MFQNLASYFLSSITSPAAATNTTAEGVEEDSSIRLRSREENEWVLVDRDSEGNSDTSSMKDEDEEDLDLEAVGATFQPVNLTRSSSTSSLHYTSTMEESWFVTPPPCFTSTGPVVMRTSPLENLLIEHPSMSVYHIHPRRQFAVRSTRSASPSSSSSSRGSSEEEVVIREVREELVPVETRLPGLNRLQALRQKEKQYLMTRQAQKVQIQKSGQASNRGNLQRTNKARKVNSRNQRQRRGQRSQGATRSCANNNRKC